MFVADWRLGMATDASEKPVEEVEEAFK